MLGGERKRGAIAGGEQLVLALVAAAPDRADRMNDVPGLEPIAAGDLGGTGVATAQRLAFGQQLRSGGAMDGAVDAAAAEQRRLAALTMASTSSVVMSATQISSRDAPTSAVSRGGMLMPGNVACHVRDGLRASRRRGRFRSAIS